MAKKTKFHAVTIDLDQFKLHIRLKDKNEVTLHFDSPSRRFYLSLIAFVVNEMKRLGKITSIPLGAHHDLLALLNETVGGSAGASGEENLLPRIYRKWKHALPNLEEAPLFKVLGKKKEYDEGASKAYPFTEAEKDSWANLFEYKGSGKNVRLKFAIEKIGAGLDDVEFFYEDALNGDAWERFISDLSEKGKVELEKEEMDEVDEEHVAAIFAPRKWKPAWPIRYRWTTLIVALGVVVGIAAIMIRGVYTRHTPHLEITDAPAGLEVASRDKMVFSLPDKPSIAVLPFVNISGDKEQDYFSDGLTEEIITALSRIPKLFVIARNSSFGYKGKPSNVQQVGRELGVKYVLEGCVRRSGNHLRITAQMIDALTGNNLWAGRYDKEMKDIFVLQDEIALEVLKALDVKLSVGERGRLHAKGTKNLEAYIKLLQARELAMEVNRENMAQVRKMVEEVIRLDPKYPIAYHFLSSVTELDVWLGIGKSPRESLMKAIELEQKAISLDDSCTNAHAHLGFLYAMIGEHERGIAECERAIEIAPNFADAYAYLAQVLNFSGRSEEAVPHIEKAFRLDPVGPPSYYYLWAAHTYGRIGRYEDAVRMCNELLSRWPNNVHGHAVLVIGYGVLGREDEARAAAQDLLRIDPKFSAQRWARMSPYKDPARSATQLELLRKAGVPD